MVNVTKKNFIEQSNDLLKYLPDAAFVAIDEEMTGIRIGRLSKDDTPEQRYAAIQEVPQRYSIIQVGICLFLQNPEYSSDNMAPEYLVRRYNFYLFPPSSDDITREVTLNPSSIAFLNQHGMDFNLWTKEGISYVTTNVAETLVKKYKTQTKKAVTEHNNNNTVRDPTRRRITLTKQEDVNFHARAMASLREWIDGSMRAGATPSLLLPACNRFLRRALYESIELEYPALILENGGAQHRDQIRVWRLSQEEKVLRKERLEKEAWEKLVLNVGFHRVFTALSNANKGLRVVNSIPLASSVEDVDVNAEPKWEQLGRRIPIICHNGLMDILFLLTHFHSHQLPNTYQQAKALIADTFPLIYDTKILATECSDQAMIGDNTVLGTLYSKFVEEDVSFIMERHFQVANASTTDPDQLHEASYDAFMTGAVFVALTNQIRGERASLYDLLSSQYDHVTKQLFGRNKLYLMLTLYTIDLENATQDPLRRGLSPTSTYRVCGIDPAISTSDIIRCLSNLVDEVERQVHFEIVWVDDRTFLVAARAHNDDETLQRHGHLIHRALRGRFSVEGICTLEQHLNATREAEEQALQKEEESQSMWSLFLGLFGYGNKRKSDEWDGQADEPRAKRRRTS